MARYQASGANSASANETAFGATKPRWNSETDSSVIERTVPLGTNTASKITVNYPFQFMVLNGVAKLVTTGSTAGKPLTMQSVAIMRNES